MVHLSVAIGRFFEALFWAIASAIGVIVGWSLLALLAMVVALLFIRRIWRRR